MTKTIDIPMDLLAEQICIGACITQHQSLELVFDRIDDGAFYDTRHKILFSCIKKFYKAGDNPKFTDIIIELERDGLIDTAGGVEYVKQLEVRTRNSEIRYYIKVLEDTQVKRNLIFLGQNLLSPHTDDPLELLEDASKALSGISSGNENPPTCLADVLSNYREDVTIFDHFIQRKRDKDNGKSVLGGVPTGWPNLDIELDGLWKKELVILGARPSMGKSEVMVQMILAMIKKGIKVMLFSLEMSKEQVAQRLVGMVSGVHSSKVIRGNFNEEEAQRIDEARNLFKSYQHNLIIDDCCNIKAHQIKARLRRQVSSSGVQVAMVDHLSRIPAPASGMNQYQLVTENVGAMKMMAQELDMPVVLAAQLNRAVTGRQVTIPNMADLRDSGAVEQDADKILLIHRPDYYDKLDRPGLVQIIIEKNREGSRKTMSYSYCSETQAFSELSYKDLEKMTKDTVEQEVSSEWKSFSR
jgi:replicative DNA helicase